MKQRTKKKKKKNSQACVFSTFAFKINRQGS